MKKDHTLTRNQRVANPCVQICVQDREDGFCLGCGRTSDEINNWQNLPRVEREKIVTTLDDRIDGLTLKRRKRRRGRKSRVPHSVDSGI